VQQTIAQDKTSNLHKYIVKWNHTFIFWVLGMTLNCNWG